MHRTGLLAWLPTPQVGILSSFLPSAKLSPDLKEGDCLSTQRVSDHENVWTTMCAPSFGKKGGGNNPESQQHPLEGRHGG